MALLSLIHAYCNGRKSLLLWFSALGHGLTTEALSYFLPDIDSFWHSQSMVMFLGGRLPLYVVLFYPTVMYTTNTAVGRLKLNLLSHVFAVGMADVLIDFPFDIMGIKLLWWTWHDTDPNIFDRHYNVPWTSYLYHMTFASAFSFLFNTTWNKIVGTGHQQRQTVLQNIVKLTCCFVMVSLLSMPLGVVQITLYHVLHDIYHIHTEVVTFIYIVIYGYVTWSGERRRPEDNSQQGGCSRVSLISVIVCIHYAFYIILVLAVAKPENLRSTGMHETVGNCSLFSSVTSVIGMTLPKKSFLCASNYSEPVFDWHCLPDSQPPAEMSQWYTVCGTPYPNRQEYILVVCTFCLLGLLVFYEILWKPNANSTKVKHKKL